MQVGSEFLHLCQEQINLLTRGLGASLAIVALVERPIPESTSENDVNRQSPSFIPVITYPEAFSRVDPQSLITWLSDIWLGETVSSSGVTYSESSDTSIRITNYERTHPTQPDQLPGGSRQRSQLERTDETPSVVRSDGALEHRSVLPPPQDRVVMPLMYQDVMVGLLVTARVDRGWNQLEQYDIQRIAQTLAAACVLDQRAQWLEQRYHQQSMAYAQLHSQQQDVVDDVLHQFRNPLTALRTFGKLLLKRMQPADRNKAVAESIVRESDRLQDLLKQLTVAVDVPAALLPAQTFPMTSSEVKTISPLDESSNDPSNNISIEQGSSAIYAQPYQSEFQSEAEQQRAVKALTGRQIQLEECHLMDILAPLMVSASAIAQERKIALHTTCLENLAPVWGDPKALREALTNLIDNALKYTPPGGQVELIVGLEDRPGAHGGCCQGVAIADTGPGIPPDDQIHLFERHFRGVQAEGTIPGTGLGLAIAKFLIQQMSGKIEVYSPIEECSISLVRQLLLSASGEYSTFHGTESPTGRVSSGLQTLDNEENSADSSPFQLVHRGPGTLFLVWLPCYIA